MAETSDTAPPLSSPPDRLDRIKAFIGDLARPFAIIVTSSAAAIATVIIARKVSDGNDGAIFIAAVFVGVGSLYLGKAWETARASRAAADVEIARATAPPQ